MPPVNTDLDVGCRASRRRIPWSVVSDEMYSTCSTRRGDVRLALDEACTIKGRITTTPPASTQQETPVIRCTHSCTCASVITPSSCVPGSTRSGPLSSVELSMWIRSATTLRSTSPGACAYSTPAFSDHGPQPGASRRVSTGRAVSWCHATSQLASGDLSNKVARNGTTSSASHAPAIRSRRGSAAMRATAGTFMRCRTPARLLGSAMRSRCVTTLSSSPASRIPGWTA